MSKAMYRDAHSRPPDAMRALFKRWQRSSLAEIQSSEDVLDFSQSGPEHFEANTIRFISPEENDCLHQATMQFVKGHTLEEDSTPLAVSKATRMVCEVAALPGLFVLPSLLSPDVQVVLLDKLLHRDLSNPQHKTNLHLHYHVRYPSRSETGTSKTGAFDSNSFFAAESSAEFEPKERSIHRPMSIHQMLQRKLRWVTLGGQYDWTTKEYPDEEPPVFPQDIAQLLKGIFPNVDAQAAIVNFYTPGDTLSVHRDVSEECDRGLISISMGCDGIFIIGNEDGSQSATVRLRSGDAVLMSGKSRFAWHAVPKILPNTCPSWLEKWPALPNVTTFPYMNWERWMKTKRVNLNVRQMRI